MEHVRYVIFSASEHGFWSNSYGWTDLSCATRFSDQGGPDAPVDGIRMPITRWGDAELRRESDFERTEAFMTNTGRRLRFDAQAKTWSDGDLVCGEDDLIGLPIDEDGELVLGSFVPEAPPVIELLHRRLEIDGNHVTLPTPELQEIVCRSAGSDDDEWDRAYLSALGTECEAVAADMAALIRRRLVAAYNATLNVPLMALEKQAREKST